MIPLGLLVEQLAQERALAQAERRAAIVVSVLAVTTDPNAVEQVIASAQGDTPAENGGGGQLAVHGLAEQPLGTSYAATTDLTRAAQQQHTVLAPLDDGVAYLEPVEIGDDQLAVVEVHVPSAALRGGVWAAWGALVVVAAGLVLGSALVGDRLANRMVRPARSLADAATALGDGALDVRVTLSGPRELAEAGYAFNQMADRLAALRTAEREMVADLSHRLRTPLTGLRLDVEALEAAEADALAAHEPRAGGYGYPAADDDDRYRTLARVRQALTTLEHEIDVLIRTTRQATQATADEPPPPGRCDAGEVVAERMSFWSAVAGDQDRPCEVVVPPTPAPVRVPGAELAAALDAVLGNAFRYTPQGTALEVAVSRHDGWVAVRVDDAGAGIADPDRALTRGASDQGSTGLGLDIARRVAQTGGGSVSVGNGRLGGASVVMLLADAEAPPPSAPSRRGLIGRLTREPRLSRRS
ncbi:HAMP domain-containing histidine kinase [Natronosporangium hydrolyticum]|uniref:Signal transduction histidine-protein kinase/phosphatase MprB n=1 Tax=Natronosporangium hydrolyticum TaxID=2811111 RepID=A0A895YN76_9ACTN|nr:HAMP domain-containing sensor histidine kinase [Natronosporangium hydrolyticum]QSB16909.1 HAMP domain-containing histidine kinase [Natronosporangium hydrolyticum]